MDKKKILMIEDEEEQIELVKARLEATGYEFISAMDGLEGIQKALGEKPDLILLDFVLPQLDGLEVFKTLRMKPETEKTPVIVVTAFGTEFVEEKCHKYGSAAFIRKPYELKDLLEKIKSSLD